MRLKRRLKRTEGSTFRRPKNLWHCGASDASNCNLIAAPFRDSELPAIGTRACGVLLPLARATGQG